MKNSIFLIIVIFAIVAFYSYRTKQNSYSLLKDLEKHTNIDFYIDSRPLLAVSKERQFIYFIHSNKIDKISFLELDKILLIESEFKGNDAYEKIGPDYGILYMNNGRKQKFTDMRITFNEAKDKLLTISGLEDKILTKENR